MFFVLLFEGDLILAIAFAPFFLGRAVAVGVLILAELKVLVALDFCILEVVKGLLVLTIGVIFLGLVLLLELNLNLVSAGQLLLSLDCLNAVFLENVLLGDDDLPHVVDHPLLDLHVDLQFDILQFQHVIFDDDF